MNNRINHIKVRALQMGYSDESSTFKELLEKNKSVSIHTQNVQVLTTETY